MIEDGLVTVNGKEELRRGRKLYPGDMFELNDVQVKVSVYDD